MLAGVHVDGGHARVGRFDQGQPLRHLRRAAAGAPGQPVGFRRAVRVEHGGAQRRVGRVERHHGRLVARRHVEHAGVGVDGRARPAGGPGRRRTHDGAPRHALDGAVERGEQRAEPEAFDGLEGHGPNLGREVDQVVDHQPLIVEGGGLRGEGLGRGGHFARHVRLRRHRTLFDGPDGLARHPVERVDETLLAHLRDGLDGAAVDGHVQQVGVGREVVVPQAVMDGLEVPHALPGLDVHRDQRLRKEVVAEAVDAVVVVGRRPRRQVHVAQLVVAGQHRPDVGVARVAPRVVQPGVDAELVSPVGHGVEVPGVLAGADVPGADPAGDRLLRDAAVGDVRAVDDPVAHHDGRRVDAEEQGVQIVALFAGRPRQPGHGVDPAAAVSEAGARPARLRVDADQVAVARAPEDALVAGPVGPPGDAALRPRVAHGRGALLVALRVEDPQGLAGRGIDGDALRERRVEVEHPADHQRRGLQPGRERPVAGPVEVGRVGDQRIDDGVEGRPPFAPAGRRPADEVVDRGPLPGDLEVREVVGVDLVERRVLGAADVPGIAAPLAVRRVVGLPRAGGFAGLGVGGGCRREQSEQRNRRDRGRLAHGDLPLFRKRSFGGGAPGASPAPEIVQRFGVVSPGVDWPLTRFRVR